MDLNYTKSLIKADLSRLPGNGKLGWVKYLFSNASFRITFWFRIGSYLKTKKGPLFKFIYFIVSLIHKHNQYLTGIQIPLGTSIGSGLCFSHFSCIVINNHSKIGKNCTIFQGVTIGSVRGPNGGVPEIGDNVVIASGAKVIGKVKVGNNVMIGAGAVIVNDIPDNSLAVGNPARIILNRGKINVDYYLNN